MAEENVTLNKVLNKLKNVAGFKDLSPNQMKTRLASLKQVAVKNALRAANFRGAAAIAAFDIAMRLAPPQTGEGKGADPLNLFGPKRKKVDKAAVEAAVKEANEFNSYDAAKTSVKKAREEAAAKEYEKGSEVRASRKRDAEDRAMRPKSRPSKLAPKESIRPKARNLNMGGMTSAKPRTGNTDYRMGGMFMKKGNK